MSRIIILGNAGGGKSTLARKVAQSRGLPHFEIDKLQWLEGWIPAPLETYARKHEEVISGEAWVIDGVGHWNSIPARVDRATEIILIDMPLWMHFWLAAERQISWASGDLTHSPGGLSAMPPTRDLFRTIWEIDQEWLPGIRAPARRRKGTAKPFIVFATSMRLRHFQATLINQNDRLTITRRLPSKDRGPNRMAPT